MSLKPRVIPCVDVKDGRPARPQARSAEYGQQKCDAVKP
jgi:imidazole glycerol phosphate synthase subunit HisF